MSEFRTLARHSSHYLSGRIGVMLLGFVSFPLFTRLFSVAEYGAISLILKFVALGTVFSKMGIQNSVLRFYPQGDETLEERRRYYSTNFFGALATAAAVTILFALLVRYAPESVLDGPLKWPLLLASALVFVRGMQSILCGFLRVEGKTGAYNAVDILVKALGTAAIGLAVFRPAQKIQIFIVGTIVVESCIIFSLIVRLLRRRVLNFDSFDAAFFRSVLAFSMPLIIYEVFSIILDSGDRVLIRHYLGDVELGFYSAAYNIAGYFHEVLMWPVHLALFPIYMKLWNSKGAEETAAFLSRSLYWFLMVSGAAIAGAIAVQHEGIVLMASRKFQEADRLLPVLILGMGVYGTHIFFNAGLLIHKKTAESARLVVYACLSNLALNLILIPKMGTQGAGVATLLSYALLIWLMARSSAKVLRVTVPWSAAARFSVAAACAVFAASFASGNNVFVVLCSKAAISASVYLILTFALEKNVRVFCMAKLRRAEPAAAAAEASHAFRS